MEHFVTYGHAYATCWEKTFVGCETSASVCYSALHVMIRNDISYASGSWLSLENAGPEEDGRRFEYTKLFIQYLTPLASIHYISESMTLTRRTLELLDDRLGLSRITVNAIIVMPPTMMWNQRMTTIWQVTWHYYHVATMILNQINLSNCDHDR